MNATLEDLLQAESDLEKWSSVQLSGKTDTSRIREWVEFQGKVLVKEGDAAYPGWGNDGTPGQPFDFSGQHYLNNQAPQTQKNSPIAMASRGHKSEPTFGTSIDFHLSTVKWPVTLGCGLDGSSGEECEFHNVKGIHTKKFKVLPGATVSVTHGKKKRSAPVVALVDNVNQVSGSSPFPTYTAAWPGANVIVDHGK